MRVIGKGELPTIVSSLFGRRTAMGGLDSQGAPSTAAVGKHGRIAAASGRPATGPSMVPTVCASLLGPAATAGQERASLSAFADCR